MCRRDSLVCLISSVLRLRYCMTRGSLLYLLMKTSRPANSILGRLPETREYRNVKRFPMAKEIPGIRIFRFDSSLHFANKDYFENRLKALVSTQRFRHAVGGPFASCLLVLYINNVHR